MIVYIEKFGESFVSDFAYSAYEGSQHLGNKVKCFNNINEVPFRFDDDDKIPLVIGCIESVKTYLTKWGIKVPEPLHIPQELLYWTNRKIVETTLGEFKNKKSKYPIPTFIKSHELKLFPSGVINEESSRSDLMFPYPDDTKIILSNVVEIISEYRCFVTKGKLIGIQFYQGDFMTYPNIDNIISMINSYSNCPISYTLDVAVIWQNNHYETVLIECNDGWSVGTYGLDGEKTIKFFQNRWLELTKDVKPKPHVYMTLKEKITKLGAKEILDLEK